jgi:hypothetical protein
LKIIKEVLDSGKVGFDTLTWMLIYGGLLSVIFGLAVGSANPVLAQWLGYGGSLVTVVGIVMIYIRSRMKE